MAGMGSKLMASMVVATAAIAVMFIFISQGMTNYSLTIPANHNTTLNYMKDMATVSQKLNTTKVESLNELSKQKSLTQQIVDLVGFYLERGLKVVSIIPSMLNVFEVMVSSGIDSAGNILGIAAGPLKFVIISLVTIAIVVGLVISSLINRDV